jgi:Ni,Fe-hydrogenase III large subunit
MSKGLGIVRAAETALCRPWFRHILTPAAWSALIAQAAAEAWVTIALWADTANIYALFLDLDSLTVVPVSTAVAEGRYKALSPLLPGAAPYERMIRDLWGHDAESAGDKRPWLDHGHFPAPHPMAARPGPNPRPEPPLLAGPDNDDAMLLPLGPVWGRLDEAMHLRLIVRGPTVQSAESLLGFTHKGTLGLMRGKSARAAARFAARLSGDATVAHSVAFARAAEAAMNIEPPPRAVALRIVMQELERIAVHLDALAETARLAEAPKASLLAAGLREGLVAACEPAFGHRLMMDVVVPGGLAGDLDRTKAADILLALGDIASGLPLLDRALERLSGRLSGRLAGLAPVTLAQAASLGAGGVVGRAAGFAMDVRSVFAHDYRNLAPNLISGTAGDAAARQTIRLLEIEDSLRLAGAALESAPAGPVAVPLARVSGEGIGFAEAARGDVWHWLRLDHGQIEAVFCRDPGWALWPLAEQVLRGAAADDVDLIRASLGLPASGTDL